MGGICFRGAAASSGTTPAQGRLVIQLFTRQLLGVRHVNSPNPSETADLGGRGRSTPGRRAKRHGPTTGGLSAPTPRAMGTPFRPAKCLRDRSTAPLGLAKRPDTFGSPEHVLSKHRRNVCTGDKRESRVTAARGESAANPLPTDPAVNCVEPQRPRRLIETDPRRGQVFPAGEGQPYWAVMRGGFMASGRVRCRRR